MVAVGVIVKLLPDTPVVMGVPSGFVHEIVPEQLEAVIVEEAPVNILAGFATKVGANGRGLTCTVKLPDALDVPLPVYVHV